MRPEAVAEYHFAFTFLLMLILLVPLAVVGLALTNVGLGRSRGASHAMTASICATSVAALVYFAWGFAIQGGNMDPFPGVNGMFGSLGTFFRGANDNLDFLYLPALFAMFSVGLASLIPLGAASDRWRLSACCASTFLFAGWIYPLFVNFANTGFHVHRAPRLVVGDLFMDAGGSGFINVTGGITALSVAWLLGARQGKYSSAGIPAAIPAHNGVFVLFGCLLSWLGWLGLNGAGAILHTILRMQPTHVIIAIINTTLSACSAALTAAAVTRIRFRKPDASLIANGWMAGLVASSAGCATLKPATAVLTGIVAGALVVFSVEFLEFRLKVDDPCGSVSVHAVCGIWGLLAAGIFSDVSGQFMAQLVGVATLLGFVFPMSYGSNWLLNRFIPYRVSIDGERQGLDLHELGADAYPEFVVHTDEFLQR